MHIYDCITLFTYALEILTFYSAQGDDLWLIIDGDCGFYKGVFGRCLVNSIVISTEKKILLTLFWLTTLFPLSWPGIKMLGISFLVKPENIYNSNVSLGKLKSIYVDLK